MGVLYGDRITSLVPRPTPSFSMLHAEKREAVADPEFEEGGFQVCGESPCGCRVKLFAKWML